MNMKLISHLNEFYEPIIYKLIHTYGLTEENERRAPSALKDPVGIYREVTERGGYSTVHH